MNDSNFQVFSDNSLFKRCRRKIVGWDVNPPDPFPGYGGCIGLLQDCKPMPDGDWLLVFRAGYWHISMATPFVVPKETLDRWEKNGFPRNHSAPTGGRIMGVRSCDNGLNWSRPFTILDTPLDDHPISPIVLRDGTVLLFVGNQASWYGLKEPPSGHLPVNTRVGVMRSMDSGHTWTEPAWLDSPYRYYQRGFSDAIQLPDGGLLLPTYCADQWGEPLRGAIHRSDDSGKTWRCISTIERRDGDIDEEAIALLPSGRIILITRLDGAVFYSHDLGVSWKYSHKTPFNIKAPHLILLKDNTLVCLLTSNGHLSVSWSRDEGKTWKLDGDGKPFCLDHECYGYPGGFVMEDESIFVVYYDGVNNQRRTGVWGLRFRVDEARKSVALLPAPGVTADNPGGLNERLPEMDAEVM